MKLKDFFFSFSQTISFELEKKKYFKAIRKTIYFPYKFILNQIRILLLINKKNIDNLKINFNENLDELFKKFNSDKGSKLEINGKIIRGHNYSPFYEKYLKKYKEQKNLTILEIGTLKGAAAASFYHYLSNPKIFCIDVNPFQTFFFSKNIRTIYSNTQSKKNIHNLVKYFDFDFDIIIDDGSHNVKDQLLTLNAFLPKLKKEGIYIIEDINQYLAFPHLNPDKIKNVTKKFLESILKKEIEIPECLTNSESENIKNNIKTIFFEKGEYIYKI